MTCPEFLILLGPGANVPSLKSSSELIAMQLERDIKSKPSEDPSVGDNLVNHSKVRAKLIPTCKCYVTDSK